MIYSRQKLNSIIMTMNNIFNKHNKINLGIELASEEFYFSANSVRNIFSKDPEIKIKRDKTIPLWFVIGKTRYFPLHSIGEWLFDNFEYQEKTQDIIEKDEYEQAIMQAYSEIMYKRYKIQLLSGSEHVYSVIGISRSNYNQMFGRNKQVSEQKLIELKLLPAFRKRGSKRLFSINSIALWQIDKLNQNRID